MSTTGFAGALPRSLTSPVTVAPPREAGCAKAGAAWVARAEAGFSLPVQPRASAASPAASAVRVGMAPPGMLVPRLPTRDDRLNPQLTPDLGPRMRARVHGDGGVVLPERPDELVQRRPVEGGSLERPARPHRRGRARCHAIEQIGDRRRRFPGAADMGGGACGVGERGDAERRGGPWVD